MLFDLIQSKSTALHYAAKSESDGPEKLRLLLEKSAKVDIQDEVRYTFRLLSRAVLSLCLVALQVCKTFSTD